LQDTSFLIISLFYRLGEIIKSGSTKYEEIFRKPSLGLIDILTVVPSLRLTANFLFQKCDLIMPRYYTIASSSAAHPEELMVAISLSRWETELPDGKVTRDGLVSGYLEDILKRHQAGEPITDSSMCFVRDSNFLMPVSHSTPIMMVGPGTGVVPFIGFM
jgi:sulfite reductase alpha subunit-like flavoprotein